jgi:hypothetical protein
MGIYPVRCHSLGFPNLSGSHLCRCRTDSFPFPPSGTTHKPEPNLWEHRDRLYPVRGDPIAQIPVNGIVIMLCGSCFAAHALRLESRHCELDAGQHLQGAQRGAEPHNNCSGLIPEVTLSEQSRER